MPYHLHVQSGNRRWAPTGTNELDQIQKIHNIIGTPPAELLAKMKQRSQHMDFNFPAREGTGIAKLIPHASAGSRVRFLKVMW